MDNIQKEFEKFIVLNAGTDFTLMDLFRAGYELARSRFIFASLNDGCIVSENITIDQRYAFEKQIKELETKILRLGELKKEIEKK